MTALPAPETSTPENCERTPQAEYYRQVLEEGVHRLFERRVRNCPMCAGNNLVREQTLTDLVLLKPGYFHMSRCRGCGHIFQNPRLNAKGLEFYYRDFYTGKGEEVVRRYLSTMTSTYRSRARMVRQSPHRWLDVGAGYGHFCRTAGELWKDTKFYVVDVSPSIRRAEELGWVERAYAGQFLEVAPQLEETYDVVSMFHYLEHTPDPIAEIHAAASVLEPNGFLMIEVPDPDSVGRRLMGRFWPSWFAPQHLHLFPPRNMGTYLRQAGLRPILWHRARTHQATDASFAMDNFLRQRSSTPNLPWIPVPSVTSIQKQLLMNVTRVPLKFAMIALDTLLSPLRVLPRWSNTYRVLAQKTEAPKETSAP